MAEIPAQTGIPIMAQALAMYPPETWRDDDPGSVYRSLAFEYLEAALPIWRPITSILVDKDALVTPEDISDTFVLNVVAIGTLEAERSRAKDVATGSLEELQRLMGRVATARAERKELKRLATIRAEHKRKAAENRVATRPQGSPNE